MEMEWRFNFNSVGGVAFVCGPDYPPPKGMVIGDWFMVFPKDGPIQLDPMTKVWSEGHRVHVGGP